MNQDRWRQIEELFSEAVEHGPESRSAFLDKSCGNDRELREEVESLLASDDVGGTLVKTPALNRALRAPNDEVDWTGQRIGPYRITHLIGEGGMGAVYLGIRDDDQYHKQVAIKLLKRGMDTSLMLSRFRKERQILANLEHPFITRLLDGGATQNGLPYFVMEHVDGVPITEFCATCRMPIDARIRLFRLVCEAVQYAHQNLVVHRDLKPSNILATREGTPKLLDFGIATVLDPNQGGAGEETLTRTGLALFTPHYASPEQVRRQRITTASDIYSLGTILYELLSGKRAHQFPSESIADIQTAICDVEPEKPSVAAGRNEALESAEQRQLRHRLSGDLDNIILTAIRKEPQRRYASVADLSEDLRRHLEGLPVLAREEQFGYRAGKFVRRHRLAVGAAALVAVSLVGGIVATTIQARRAERRFQEVRGLANSFLFDIHDQIEALPGSTRVRESIVSTVLKYLNNLADEAHGDPSLQLELATAYQKVGDVQGYGVRPNLGQREAAIASHGKALAIAQQLAERDRDDPKVIRLLALSHHRVGFLKEGGQKDSQGGIDHYQRAEELLEPLFRVDTANSSDGPLLISIYGHHGDAEVLRGRPRQAAALWQKAVNTAEEWARRQPGDASRTALGVAHWRLAKGAQLSGALDGARRHAMRAIALQEELAKAQPINPARQRMLLNSYERMAFVAADPENLNLGDRAAAFRWNSKVVEIARRLRDADPSNRMAESDFLISMRSQCQFAPEDDPDALIRICQEGLSLVRRPDFIEVGPMAATRIGPVLARKGKRVEALQTMTEGLEQLIHATTRFPWRADLKRQLIRFHRAFGDVYLTLRDRKQALVEYRAGLHVAEPLLQLLPNDLVLRRDLADHYVALGRYYESVAGAANQALEWYRKDLVIWTDWARNAESSAVDRSRRQEAQQNVARCLAAAASRNYRGEEKEK